MSIRRSKLSTCVGARAYVCDSTFSFSAREREKDLRMWQRTLLRRRPFRVPAACCRRLIHCTTSKELGNYDRSCYNVIWTIAKLAKKVKKWRESQFIYRSLAALLQSCPTMYKFTLIWATCNALTWHYMTLPYLTIYLGVRGLQADDLWEEKKAGKKKMLHERGRGIRRPRR